MLGHFPRNLTILCAICFAFSVKGDAMDWDSLYDVYGNTSLEESLDVVAHCPVSYYFDTHKGFYRVGFIANSLNESYSAYLITVSRMYRGPDGVMHTEEVPSVDVVSLFSKALPAIQHLGSVAELVAAQIEEFKKEKDDFALKIIRIARQTGTEWRTANEIRAAREVLQRRVRSLQDQLGYAEEVHRLEKENVKIRHEKRMAMRDEHHEALLSLRAAYESQMVALKLRRQNESLAFSKEMQSEKYREKERMIEEEYRFATEQLMTEIEMSIGAIHFRGQEESRVERENEAVSIALMQAKGELQVQRVQAVVDTFFVELEGKLRFLFEDPRIVAAGAVVVVVLLALVVVLTELFNSGKTVLKSLLRRSSLLTQVGAVSASSASSSSPSPARALSVRADGAAARAALVQAVSASVVLSAGTEARLVDIMAAMLLSKEYFSAGDRPPQGGCLPNVLISCPHGNGKSTAAQLLVRCTGIEFAVVSGNDLRAHGTGADRTFRNILEACVAKSVKKNKQFVLVIDDVDAIALSQVHTKAGVRSPARPGSGRKRSLSGMLESRVLEDMTANLAPAMKACIHLLLHTFKNSSPFLGLVMTSTAPVEALNEALLDRMDHIVCIDTPSTEQRLQCCVRQTAELLRQYMPTAAAAEFQTIYEAVINNRDFGMLGGKAKPSSNGARSELATPKTGRKRASSRKSVPKAASGDEEADVAPVGEQSHSDLDITACILYLVTSTTNWSYRDVNKTLQSIQCEVLGTDRCEVTGRIWMQEVRLAVQKWGR